jgi:hypothetical protein
LSRIIIPNNVYARHGRVVNGVQVPCEKTAYGNIHNHYPKPTLEG